MNVVVANKYQTLLANLNIEVMKTMYGEYDVEEIISTFQTFFYNRMILDITAIRNHEDIRVIQKLSISLDMSKVILLLDDSVDSSSSAYLSKLISMGIYNFTTTIDGVKYLLESPNSYRDVAHIQQLDNDTVSTNNEVVKTNASGARVIGIRNVTNGAGATTLTYMMKKHLEKNYTVIALELDKRDFEYFKDSELVSISTNELGNFLAKNNAKEVVLVDMNRNEAAEQFMTDIIYLIEPTTIKLNRLMQINPVMIPKLKDKKVVLNKSLLNAQDVMEFEYESRLTILYNIPPLDEKNDDIYTMKAFLETIGFHRIDTSDAVEKKDKILGIF